MTKVYTVPIWEMNENSIYLMQRISERQIDARYDIICILYTYTHLKIGN